MTESPRQQAIAIIGKSQVQWLEKAGLTVTDTRKRPDPQPRMERCTHKEMLPGPSRGCPTCGAAECGWPCQTVKPEDPTHA